MSGGQATLPDQHFMARALELARKGLYSTHPNPRVGCVIVRDGQIVGEGWHARAGEPHAEVHALRQAGDKARGATAYVTLEPCSHFGKTPPCCDLIIQQKIPNIVIGTIDLFAKVSGNGIRKLEEAGRNVTVGILEKECNELNKRFFTFHQKKRPYIILKWAESADGFLSPDTRDEQKPVWITNTYSRQLVHKWRTEEQAILAGTQTVLDDNPKLNSRDWKGNNPIRIVLDRTGKIPNHYAVKDNTSKTVIITEQEKTTNSENIIFENTIFDSSLPDSILKILYKNDIQSVIIEGGKMTLQTFIGAISLVSGTAAPKFKGELIDRKNILNDELLIFKSHD